MRVTYDIKLIIIAEPNVSLSAHEVENLIKRSFAEVQVWEVKVLKRLDPRSIERKPQTLYEIALEEQESCRKK